MINLYEQVPIGMHIKMVQQAQLDLDNDKSKQLKISTFSKRLSELNQMRYPLIQRLELMDRTLATFFPVGCLVEYIHPMYSQKQKFGEVLAHVEDMCLCHFQGDSFDVKVDPIHLKLRFIRTTY